MACIRFFFVISCVYVQGCECFVCLICVCMAVYLSVCVCACACVRIMLCNDGVTVRSVKIRSDGGRHK
jgi:hypothetical protein